MKDVTTLENEIARHREIADLMQKFAALTDDAQIFTPTVIAAVHYQTARRLQELKAKLAEAAK